MQPDLVRRVGETAEQVALACIGVAQQRQRLVGVAGQHHLVEAVPVARRVAHLHAFGQATDGAGRRAEPRAPAQRRHDALDIGSAAAAHRAPVQLRTDREQAVIVEEAHEGLRRKVEHAAERRRPDAGGHRHQVAVAKGIAQARIVDEVADGDVEILATVEQLWRQSVEAQDIVRHAQEGRPHDIAPLGKIAGEGTAVLEAAALEAGGKRHVRSLGRHAQMVEQGHEIGVVALVEHDEADIDRLVSRRRRRVDCAGVAAEAALALVDHDVVLAAQQPGGAQTGYAGADDGDFHRLSLLPVRQIA
jgi:hypothetical protein